MRKHKRLLAVLLLVVMMVPMTAEVVFAEQAGPEINRIVPEITNGGYRSLQLDSYSLEGRVEEDCRVDIYNGFDKIASVDAKDGSFKLDISLKQGYNNIRAKSVIDGVESEFSAGNSFVVDSKGPRIEVGHESTIHDDRALLKVDLRDDSPIDRLLINGERVKLIESSYRGEVAIEIGENKFRLEAFDSLGNKSEKEYRIIREEKIVEAPEDPDDEIIDIPCIILKRVILAELGKLPGLNFDHLNRPTDLTVTRKELESLEEIYFEEGNHFDLYDYNIYITSFEGLEYAKNINKLRLSYNRNLEAGGGIKELVNHTKLEYVKLRDNQITSIEPLKNNKNINYLECSINQIEDISVVENFRDLENLDFSANLVSDISSLRDLTKLHTLNISSNRIEDISSLKGLTNLENYLYMSRNKIEDISALEGMTRLKDLDLSSNKLSDIGALGSLESLERLWVNYNREIKDLGPLEKLGSLKNLGLRGLDQVEDFSPLMKLTNLESLILAETRMEGKEEDVLRAIKIQERMDRLEDRSLENIRALRRDYMDLDPMVRDLMDISKLVAAEKDLNIQLDLVEFKDEKFRELINRSLGKKDLTGDITVDEMLTIEVIDGTSMPFVEMPEEHKKDKQGPQFRGIRDISGIKYAKNLRELTLSENLIVDLGELAGLEKLEHLDILRNRVEDLSPIAKLRNISYLNIYNNEISDLDPLYDLDKIEFFDCHFNRQKDGIDNIEGLRNKPVMNYCNIESNFIEDISPLKDMPVLENVGVGGNRIKDLRPLARLIDDYFLNGYFITGAPKDQPNLYVGMNFQKDFGQYHYNIGGDNKLEFKIPVEGMDSFIDYARENFEVDLPLLEKLPEGVEGELRGDRIIFSFPEPGEERVEYDLSGLGLEYEVYYLAFQDFKVVQEARELEKPLVEREFKDIKNSWARASIDYLKKENALDFIGGNKFKPNKLVTREEGLNFIKSMGNISPKLNLEGQESDILAWAEETGLLDRLTVTRFKSKFWITREEAALLIDNYMGLILDEEVEIKNVKKYKDDKKISPWAKEAVYRMNELGLLTEDGKNKFNPSKKISRGELAVILEKIARQYR